MMDKMNLGDFSPKVMAAILYSILTLLAFSVYPMLVGAGNTIHLNTESACVQRGVRFDRILLVLETDTVTTADNGTWSNAVSVTNGSSGCQVVANTGQKLGDAAETEVVKTTSYVGITPTGEKTGTITTPDPLGSAGIGIAALGTDKAEWKAPAGMFTDNGTLVDVVIGALALLIGVSPMTVLGMIGYYILSKFDMEQGTIAAIIMVVLGAVITTSLLSTFITFISTAYDAIDAQRFSVFGGGLANLAVVIKQFWGVVLVVSFFGLGAMLFKTWRDNRNGNNSGAMQESRVLS